MIGGREANDDRSVHRDHRPQRSASRLARDYVYWDEKLMS